MGRLFATTLTVTAAAALLPACSSESKGDGLNEVNLLVGAIERVHTSTELAQERAHVALRQLESLVVFDFKGDPVAAYSLFANAVEASTQQVDQMHASVGLMKENSEPVFARWAKDLEEFKDLQMRLRSQSRLKETRERYDTVASAAELASAGYDAFNAKLCDYSTYLGHDFNAASVAGIQNDVRAMSEMLDGLDARFDACTEAARTYIEAASLPTNTPAASTEEAPKSKEKAPATKTPSKNRSRSQRRDG